MQIGKVIVTRWSDTSNVAAGSLNLTVGLAGWPDRKLRIALAGKRWYTICFVDQHFVTTKIDLAL